MLPLPSGGQAVGFTHGDAIPPDPPYTISVSAGDTLTIEIAADGPPYYLRADVHVSVRDTPILTITPELSLTAPISFDLPDGTYMVMIYGSWHLTADPRRQINGAVSYAFRISVN